MIMRDRRLTNIVFTLVFFFTTSTIYAQSKLAEKEWVDSVYRSLSMEERIGQLLVIRANNVGEDYLKDIDKYIKDYNIGVWCLFFQKLALQPSRANQ